MDAGRPAGGADHPVMEAEGIRPVVSRRLETNIAAGQPLHACSPASPAVRGPFPGQAPIHLLDHRPGSRPPPYGGMRDTLPGRCPACASARKP